jgi:hypothetical protein
MLTSAARWSRNGWHCPDAASAAAPRTLVAFKEAEKAFFIFGFAKNERANVSDKELQALKLLARSLLNCPAASLAKATEAGELIEIEVNDDG